MNKLLLLAAAFAATNPALPALAEPATAAVQNEDRFSVEVRGEGPDVILIPGLLSPRSVWDDVANALQASHRLHLIEVAGFGSTPAGPNEQGEVLPQLVSAIADYIDREGLQAPAIIGHSMGGFTGLNLALDHPDKVGKLMIVDSLPFFSVLMDPNATPQSIEPRAAMMRQMMAAGQDMERPPVDCASPSAQSMSMSLTVEGRCKVDEYTAGANLIVGGQLMYEIMTSDLRPRLAEMQVPVTMLYPYAPPLNSERTQALYSAQYANLEGARLIAIAEARHFIMLDQPDRFLEEVEAFLAP